MPTGVSFMRSRLTNVSHWFFFWRKVLTFFCPLFFLTIVLGVGAAQWSSPFCDIGTWLTHRCITSSQKKNHLHPPDDSWRWDTLVRRWRLSWADHIAGKGDYSLQHYNLVHKFIPMPQAMKIPAAKAAVDKEWENCRKFRRGTWRKSEVWQRWSMKQGRRAKKFT